MFLVGVFKEKARLLQWLVLFLQWSLIRPLIQRTDRAEVFFIQLRPFGRVATLYSNFSRYIRSNLRFTQKEAEVRKKAFQFLQSKDPIWFLGTQHFASTECHRRFLSAQCDFSKIWKNFVYFQFLFFFRFSERKNTSESRRWPHSVWFVSVERMRCFSMNNCGNDNWDVSVLSDIFRKNFCSVKFYPLHFHKSSRSEKKHLSNLKLPFQHYETFSRQKLPKN